jgi:hypothetical protein
LHCLSCHILFTPCILFEEPFILSLYFLLLSWETSVDIFLGMAVKSTSGGCFSVLVFLNLSPWGHVWFYLTCGTRCYFMFHKHILCCFSVSFFNKKKMGEKMWSFILLMAFQILHVFLPDISIHCALIKYVYIWLRVYPFYLVSLPVAS